MAQAARTKAENQRCRLGWWLLIVFMVFTIADCVGTHNPYGWLMQHCPRLGSRGQCKHAGQRRFRILRFRFSFARRRRNERADLGNLTPSSNSTTRRFSFFAVNSTVCV